MYGTAASGRENAASPISPSFGKLAKTAQTVPKEGQLYSHFLCQRPNDSVHMVSPPPTAVCWQFDRCLFKTLNK